MDEQPPSPDEGFLPVPPEPPNGNGGLTPSISAVDPGAALPGKQVTLTGKLLFGGATVSFTLQAPGATARTATATAAGLGKIAVTVPDVGGAGATAIAVGADGATWDGFVVLAGRPPQLDSLSAAAALARAQLTLHGSGFGYRGSPTGKAASGFGVSFGGVAAQILSWAPAAIVVTVPPGAGGSVVVHTPWGDSAGKPFTLVLPPAIGGFDRSPLLPGGRVTVSGSNFGDRAGTLRIGGAEARVERWTPTAVVAWVPGPTRLNATDNLDVVVTALTAAGMVASAAKQMPVGGRPSITSWTRLEPRARIEDLDAGLALGLQARVEDAAWLLARQWQLGEFEGDDAGSPVVARLGGETAPLQRFAVEGLPQPTHAQIALRAYSIWDARGRGPGHAMDDWLQAERELRGATPAAWEIRRLAYADWEARGRGPGHALDDWLRAERDLTAPPDAPRPSQPVPADVPVQTLVERETRSLGPGGPPGRAAEAGLAFLRLLSAHLDPAPAAALRQAYVDAYPLAAPDPALDPASLRALRLAAGRVPDGNQLVVALAQALPPARRLPASPPIDAADAPGVLAAVADWFDWCAATADEGDPGTSAWTPERLEYRFAVSAETGAGELVLAAPEHTGGELDWHAFEVAAGTSLRAGPAQPVVAPLDRRLVPSPVSYPGMPAQRWWQFEDARVDLGAVSAGTSDLAHLFLVEFATVYGNDWFLLPVGGIPAGSLVRLQSIAVTDTFGDVTSVGPFAAGDPTWRLFEPTGADETPAAGALFLPPTTPPPLESDPLEQVTFLRDELASLAWAVEDVVESPAGLPVRRAESWQRRQEAAAGQPPPSDPTALRYRLQTEVPDFWIPLVPERDGDSLELLRGQMRTTLPDGTIVPVAAQGRILEPDQPRFALRDEQLTRAGIQARRRYRYARWLDGSTHVWVARVAEAGRGEGTSGLRFDTLDP